MNITTNSSTSNATIVGVVFSRSESTARTGFVVNLSPEKISLHSLHGVEDVDRRYKHFRQLFVADPTIAINHAEEQITKVSGSVEKSGSLVLMPYSVTSLF